ncbi:hypothetical protein [Ascidiimonas sp. W6]|uniref:hypothetical protein n=1 Tax=Ascidiimonas meishanensis TaxID=3128903 RepID=UPI0030EB94A4
MGKQKSKLERKEEIRKHYQAWKVIAVAGYVNEERESLAKEIIEKVALENGFIPSYFATIVLTEGLGITYLDLASSYSKTAPYNLRNDIIVEGYQLGGVDDFGYHFKDRYKKYLPKSFNEGFSKSDLKSGAEFMKVYQSNERGESIVTADFNNMESLIWACGATLAHRRDLFLKHVAQLGYSKPSEDQLAYWTYMYYQGEGRAYKSLKNNGLDIFKINSTLASNRTITKEQRDPNDVALSNLASWRYLQEFKIFSR